MRLGSWIFYLILFMFLLVFAALATGGYLLYGQNRVLAEIIKDNRRLRLSAQNLETMVRSLQDRKVLTNMPVEAMPSPPSPSATGKTAPKLRKEPPPPAKDSPDPNDDQAGNNGDASTPQEAAGVEPWPTTAPWVKVEKVRLQKTGNDLLVYFDIVNKLDNKHPAQGFVSVLLRSDRKGDPWVESWPPARLTPLGQPEDPKKGASFSLDKQKRFRARFVLVDKKVEAVEFLIFNKQGELALLMRETPGSAQKSK